MQEKEDRNKRKERKKEWGFLTVRFLSFGYMGYGSSHLYFSTPEVEAGCQECKVTFNFIANPRLA